MSLHLGIEIFIRIYIAFTLLYGLKGFLTLDRGEGGGLDMMHRFR